MTLEDLVPLRSAIAELCARYGVVELSVCSARPCKGTLVWLN